MHVSRGGGNDNCVNPMLLLAPALLFALLPLLPLAPLLLGPNPACVEPCGPELAQKAGQI